MNSTASSDAGPFESPLIPKDDKIPWRQKLAFSAGSSVDYIAAGMTLGALWMPYFNIGLGISPTLLGVILMILQGWNAIIDPVMGNASDNARTRWGRRRPFMVVGSFLTAALYPLIWRPPESWGEKGQVAYIIVMGIMFFSAFSCWAMPYYGMQLELTPNYDERTRLMAWLTFVNKLNALLSGWALAIISGPWFADPVTGEPDIVKGMKASSWVIALFILIVGLLPALFVRERYYESEARKQKKDPFWQSIKESARCRPLWGLVGIMFFLVVGSSCVGSLGQYLNIYYVCGGDLGHASVIGGWKSTVIMVTGILCIPLWTWMGEKFDKKTIVGLMLGMTMLGHFLNYWCLNPEMPYLQLIPGVFESGAISAVWLFIPSMKGDIADYDELGTARRREGSINAFFSWFFKLAMTVSMGVGGLVLDISGFDVKRDTAQPPEVLREMLWMYLLLPMFIWALGMVMVRLYPLDRGRMAGIRSTLEQRRGAI